MVREKKAQRGSGPCSIRKKYSLAQKRKLRISCQVFAGINTRMRKSPGKIWSDQNLVDRFLTSGRFITADIFSAESYPTASEAISIWLVYAASGLPGQSLKRGITPSRGGQ
jgi:hypothetical protein